MYVFYIHIFLVVGGGFASRSRSKQEYSRLHMLTDVSGLPGGVEALIPPLVKTTQKVIAQTVELLKSAAASQPEKYLGLSATSYDKLPAKVNLVLHMARAMSKLPKTVAGADEPLKSESFHERLVTLNQLDGLDLEAAKVLVPDVKKIVESMLPQTVKALTEFHAQAEANLEKANAYLQKYYAISTAAKDWNLDLVRPLLTQAATCDPSKDQTEVDVQEMTQLVTTVMSEKSVIDKCGGVICCKGNCQHPGLDEAKELFALYKSNFDPHFKDALTLCVAEIFLLHIFVHLDRYGDSLGASVKAVSAYIKKTLGGGVFKQLPDKLKQHMEDEEPIRKERKASKSPKGKKTKKKQKKD
jgi:hypothetical protein